MLELTLAIYHPGGTLLFSASLAVVVLLGGAAAARVVARGPFRDDRPNLRFDHTPSPIDRGALLPDFGDEEAIRSLAAQHAVTEPPKQVEENRTRRFRGGAPHGLIAGEAGQGLRIVREPRDDLGELVRKVVKRLDERGDLNQSVDEIGDWPGFDAGDRARLQAWLEREYPSGLASVSPTELAGRITSSTTAAWIGEQLRADLQAIESSQRSEALYFDGYWKVHDDGFETLLLSRTHLRVRSRGEDGPRVHSIPMPADASITMRLAEDELTARGRNRLVRASRPIKAVVLATAKHYDPTTACLELVPIAICERIGG